MFFRASSSTKRRISGVMVLVWLFAVLSSAVNACVLSESDRGHGVQRVALEVLAEMGHGHDHAAEAADDDHAHSDDHGVTQASGHGDHDHPMPTDWASASGHSHHDEGTAGCHKFCKDESATLTKNKNLESPNFSLALVNSGGLPPPFTQTPMRVQRVQERPQAQGPPLVIRFLRLTL
jgi:hypothetical protein